MTVRESTVAVSGIGLWPGGGPGGQWLLGESNGFLISPLYAVVDAPCTVGTLVQVTLAKGQSISGKVVESLYINNIGLMRLSSPAVGMPFLRWAKTAAALGALVMEVGSR